MKIVTASNGKKTLTISKKEWITIGKKANWIKISALNISYTGIVPQDSISGDKVVPSRSILSQIQIPEGRAPYANHMTINLGVAKDQSSLGKDIEFSLTSVASDDKVMAAQVESKVSSMNNPPHITLAVNPNGGKPMMAGKLTDWKPIAPIPLKGRILEVTQDGTIVTSEMKQQDQAGKAQEEQSKQQEAQLKKSTSPTNVIRENKMNREQAIEFLKSKNIPQQAWENILKDAGI